MALLNDIGVGAAGDDPNKKIESLVKQINEWGRILSNEDRTNITNDDSGKERLLIGYQQGGFENGDVGGKLSQEGVSVLTATGDQLIWSTDFNSFKIVDSGPITIPAHTFTSGAAQYAGGTGPINSIPHGLDFAPVVIAVANTSLGPTPLPLTLNGGSGTDNFALFTLVVTADSTNVEAFMTGLAYNVPGGRTYPDTEATYYLLREVSPT